MVHQAKGKERVMEEEEQVIKLIYHKTFLSRWMLTSRAPLRNKLILAIYIQVDLVSLHSLSQDMLLLHPSNPSSFPTRGCSPFFSTYLSSPLVPFFSFSCSWLLALNSHAQRDTCLDECTMVSTNAGYGPRFQGIDQAIMIIGVCMSVVVSPPSRIRWPYLQSTMPSWSWAKRLSDCSWSPHVVLIKSSAALRLSWVS